jgi:hypothetical protein
VRGKCVHPGNLRRQRSQNDRPVPRSSPKNQKKASPDSQHYRQIDTGSPVQV